MTELQELQDELRIAKKYNFPKREITHLEDLIQRKTEKKKKMGIKEFILWIISISLMVMFSFSAYPEIIKVRVVKPKKSKTEQQKRSEKKEAQEEDREHECEKERLLARK